MSTPLYLLFGVGLTLLTLTVLSFICAIFCNLTPDPLRYSAPLSLAALILTAFIASYLISRLRGEGGMGASVAAMAVFVTIRITVSLIDGGVGLGDLFDCLCYLGVGLLAAFLGGRTPRRRRR